MKAFNEHKDVCPSTSQTQEQATSNPSANDLDPETQSRLKGDAIGETMYSQVFVLKTLMQFSDLKWGPQLEDDLCFLWDMSEEVDVCKYLFKVSFPSLACSVIGKHSEGRLIEIVVGIFANMMCADYEFSVTEQEIGTVLSVLASDDPLVLIQVVRFLHAVAFKFDKLPFITGEMVQVLVFILLNSNNKDLLVNTLKAFSAITSDFKLAESLVKGEFLNSATVAFKTITTNEQKEFELETRQQQLSVKYFIEAVCNLCIYIDTLKVVRLRDEINSNSLITSEFIDQVQVLLNFYRKQDNLLPLTDEFKFYIDALSFIFRVLPIGYNANIFVDLGEMMNILVRNGSDDIEEIAEFFCYFISVQNPCILASDLDGNFQDSNGLKTVIDVIKSNKYHFEFDYKEHFKEMYLILKFNL